MRRGRAGRLSTGACASAVVIDRRRLDGGARSIAAEAIGTCDWCRDDDDELRCGRSS
jgi:hypothetical protein